ncbi:hypothetical protein [Streptomyces sp. R41]|uniref:Uncharacterized protein n=1 Tax=Streptomyces sp. R41 TaxID=3238632 RepID=A0AB39R8R8_9ACTN
MKKAAQQYVDRAPYGDGRPTDDIEHLLGMLEGWDSYCGEAGAAAADSLLSEMQKLDNFSAAELRVDTSEIDLTHNSQRFSLRAAFKRGLRG